MIRFRFGQTWKREPTRRPMDAFGLELDGVDLFAGASEEPLDRVVAELAEALGALVLRGERLSEFALPEAHLEVTLRRSGTDVLLEVVSVGRPARRVRGPVRLDLQDLVEAAVEAGHVLLRDVSEAGAPLPTSTRRTLSRRIGALAHAPARPPTAPGAARAHVPWRLHHDAPASGGFAFDLEDPEGLVATWDGRAPGALTSLLCDGALALVVGGERVWQSRGVPFLMALELARQGADLVHALELSERSFTFLPGGQGPKLEVAIREGVVRAPDRTVAFDAAALARSMFEPGQALAVAVTQHNRAQAKNPWLSELVARSREGLARLGGGITPPGDARAAVGRRARAISDRPLHPAGRVRRLRFEKRWEKTHLTPEDRGRILLGRRGPIVSSADLAAAFSARGELIFRHVATHGVAVAADGFVITASADRVVGYRDGSKDATWFRDHDGLPIGPELLRREGVCLVPSQARSALAFSEVTGRELWRLVPPRTQRSHLAVQGHRVLVGTDTGYVYGLDLQDGQTRFRLRAALPPGSPPVAWGRRFVTSLGRGDRSLVFAADAHTGQVAWTHELSLGALTQPAVVSNRVLVAGEDEGEGVLVCLSARGERLWERRLHMGPARYRVQGFKRAVVVTSSSGAATLFRLDGVTDWRIGAAGEELPAALPACHARGVLVVPGELTRAVDPRGGRVLAEVRTGLGLVDLKVDARMNLYALDEDGTLGAFRLTTSLAVV